MKIDTLMLDDRHFEKGVQTQERICSEDTYVDLADKQPIEFEKTIRLVKQQDFSGTKNKGTRGDKKPKFLYKPEELKILFRNLADTWLMETGHFSSVADKVAHPCYHQIMGLGLQAVPLIIQELQTRPNFWFYALKTITREDPTKPEDNFRSAVAAWVKWAEERGYTHCE